VKQWYLSKTIWLNIIAMAIGIIQAAQGQVWFNPEWQVFILAVLNGLVRLLTNTAITGRPAAQAAPEAKKK